MLSFNFYNIVKKKNTNSHSLSLSLSYTLDTQGNTHLHTFNKNHQTRLFCEQIGGKNLLLNPFVHFVAETQFGLLLLVG